MFGGAGGATRCQRPGTGEADKSWLAEAGKPGWQGVPGRMGEAGNTDHTASSPTGGRRARWGPGSAQTAAGRMVMGNSVVIHGQSHAHGKTLQGAAGKSWSWRHSRGHEHEGRCDACPGLLYLQDFLTGYFD